MSDKRTFILAHPQARTRAGLAVATAPDGFMVVISEPGRNSGQNARFHWLCGLAAKAGLEWAGKKRNAAEWKVLYVSGHATATREGSEMVPGLEGEFVNIRESTALMSVRRGTSLIEYVQADLTSRGVQIPDFAEEYACT